MKNYEVLVNGNSTGQMIVNTKNEESAINTWLNFNPQDKGKIAFKPIFINYPPMFQSCIFALENSVN